MISNEHFTECIADHYTVLSLCKVISITRHCSRKESWPHPKGSLLGKEPCQIFFNYQMSSIVLAATDHHRNKWPRWLMCWCRNWARIVRIVIYLILSNWTFFLLQFWSHFISNGNHFFCLVKLRNKKQAVSWAILNHNHWQVWATLSVKGQKK